MIIGGEDHLISAFLCYRDKEILIGAPGMEIESKEGVGTKVLIAIPKEVER